MPEQYIQKESSLVSGEINEVLGAAPAWTLRWGSMMLLGVVLLLIFLSCFIKYPDVIYGRAIIAPLAGKGYAITAVIPTAGSGKIKTGQRVSIKLDSYPASEFGSISGAVLSRPLPAAGNTVVVAIRLDNGCITNYHKQLDIYKREEGQAEIITADKRLVQRIFSFFN